jgi:hypothetical protein
VTVTSLWFIRYDLFLPLFTAIPERYNSYVTLTRSGKALSVPVSYSGGLAVKISPRRRVVVMFHWFLNDLLSTGEAMG